MRFILKDWDRIWFLAFASEAKRFPGRRIGAPSAAGLALSRLLQDSGNLSVARSLLSAGYPRAAGPVPGGYRDVLGEIARRLERREVILVPGPRYDLRTGGAGRSDAAARENEVWDFVPLPAEDAAETVPEAPPPILRFSVQGENPFPIRFAHGSDMPPGLAFGHALAADPVLGLSHGTEAGPAPAFAHTAEDGMGGLGHSSEIHFSP